MIVMLENATATLHAPSRIPFTVALPLKMLLRNAVILVPLATTTNAIMEKNASSTLHVRKMFRLISLSKTPQMPLLSLTSAVPTLRRHQLRALFLAPPSLPHNVHSANSALLIPLVLEPNQVPTTAERISKTPHRAV